MVEPPVRKAMLARLCQAHFARSLSSSPLFEGCRAYLPATPADRWLCEDAHELMMSSTLIDASVFFAPTSGRHGAVSASASARSPAPCVGCTLTQAQAKSLAAEAPSLKRGEPPAKPPAPTPPFQTMTSPSDRPSWRRLGRLIHFPLSPLMRSTKRQGSVHNASLDQSSQNVGVS